MGDNLTNLAITEALKGNWKEAITLNKEILKENESDIEALNRLSRAYFECGDVKNAVKTSKKVIELDPVNSIAQRSLKKYKVTSTLKVTHNSIDSSDFIEENGTSKHTELLNICSKDLLSSLCPGDELLLATHSHKVSVNTLDSKYVGKLPDDLSAKIRALTKKGYKFKVVVKSTTEKQIKVIVKEIQRGKNFENIKSFAKES